MTEKIACSCALIIVAYLTGQDIKKRMLSVKVLLGAGVLALLYRGMMGELDGQYILWCAWPGALLCMLSFLSGEALGYGDGVTVMVLGLWCGGLFALEAALLGFFLSGFYAVFLLLRKKKENIPFLPFLLAAMEVIFIYE